MKSILVVLCLLMIQVLANTEAFYFRIPKTHQTEIKNHELEQITIDEVTNLKFSVPSPNSQGHSYKWFDIKGGHAGHFYNARLSWSALDPIDVIHFDFETINERNETGLFLYFESKYDCYSKDQEFMNSEHEVEAKILISSTYLFFIPNDILPNLVIILSLVIVGFHLHGYVFEWLTSVK